MNISTIRKRYRANGTTSYAVYSQCMRYRYELTRVWNSNGKRILFVMLNPSTATERKNDPTLARCERRARCLSFGAFRVCNLFAYRATKPTNMKKAPSPIGQLNDDYIRAGCNWADQIVCAWGNHGAHMGREGYVTQLLRQTAKQLYCLAETNKGHPRHPIGTKNADPLLIW